MNKPFISVVIPTFNRKHVISRAIDSVIKQSFNNWELIIVDDHSSDLTKEFIKSNYSDHRIRFMIRPDGRQKGANTCRNIGIENAKGKYIAFLDSDDEWKKEHLDKCYEFAEFRTSFTASYSNSIIKQSIFYFKEISREVRQTETHLDFLIGSGSAKTPTYFIKADLAKNIMFDEELQQHQDWDFFIRFGEKYYWFYNPSTEVIVHRDLREVTKSVNLNSCIIFYNKHIDKFTIKKHKIKYLRSMYDKSILSNDYKAIKFYNEILTNYGVILKKSPYKDFLFNLKYSKIYIFFKLIIKQVYYIIK